jgi:ParB family chromosome partitioning protein
MSIKKDPLNGAVQLKIYEIEPNRDQPRKVFDETALAELADSIARHGVLQPLMVRPLDDGGYQLVAGERRWRAARMAGLTEVPVVIRPMNDQAMMEIAMIENLQREDLNPVEEAEGYRHLMETCNLTQEEVAKTVGKSRPAVANALRLLALPADVLQKVSEGLLTPGHGRSLLAFPANQIPQLAEDVIKKGTTVRELERMAKALNRKKDDDGVKAVRRNVFLDEVELALSEQLGRRVRVNNNGMSGMLEVEFYNLEDLRDLAQRLGREE